MKVATFVLILLSCILNCRCRSVIHPKSDEISVDLRLRHSDTNAIKVIVSGQEEEPVDILRRIDNLDPDYHLCQSREDIVTLTTSDFSVQFKSRTCPKVLPKVATTRGVFLCQQLTMKVSVLTRHFVSLYLLGEMQLPPPTLDVGVACVMAPISKGRVKSTRHTDDDIPHRE